MGAPYIYDISRLRVKDLQSATYIYVVRRLRVNEEVMAHWGRGGLLRQRKKNWIFTVYGNIFDVLLTVHLATASQHKRMTIPIAVYTEKYLLMMGSKPAPNMLRLIIEIN